VLVIHGVFRAPNSIQLIATLLFKAGDQKGS